MVRLYHVICLKRLESAALVGSPPSLTNPDAEAVEAVLVDVLQLFAQAQRVVRHRGHVPEPAQVARRRRQPCKTEA